MGTYEEAVEWARANLSPTQLQSFAQQVGLQKTRHFKVSVAFEYVPDVEVHLVDVAAVARRITKLLMDTGLATDVKVDVASRDEY